MSDAARATPVEKFLGRQSVGGGAFALLELMPGACADEQVLVSLERQLDRIAQHPEGDTPEAEEVRLALHAAAAQLLDRNVRRHLAERMQFGASGSTGAMPAPFNSGAAVQRGPRAPGGDGSGGAGPMPSASSASLMGLERDALLTLAQYGGWNKRSLHRLAAMAQARGMTAQDVARAVQHLATRRRPGPAKAARRGGPRPAVFPGPTIAGVDVRGETPVARVLGDLDAETPGEPDPGDPAAMVLKIVAIGLFALVGLAVLALVILLTVKPGSAPGPGSSPQEATDSVVDPAAAVGEKQGPPEEIRRAEGTARSAASSATAVPAGGLVDPRAVVRALRDASARAALQPDEAAEQVEAAAKALAQRWPRFDPALRRAADAAVVDAVYATAGWPEAGGRVLEAICAGAEPMLPGTSKLERDEIWPAAWSIGMLTRLGRERETTREIASRVDATLSATIGDDRPRLDAGFETGAMAALRRMPLRILAADASPPGAGGPGPVELWAEAVGAVATGEGGGEGGQRERLLVDALEDIMVRSAEPASDRRIFQAIQTLATQVKWRREGPARARLLEWFRDGRVSVADLQVLTGALAGRSSAEGVDPTMVLSAGASEGDRQKLRDLYARAWGLAEAAGREAVSSGWLKAAKERLREPLSTNSPMGSLEAAVATAELNEAAMRLWRGETTQAEDLIDQAGDAGTIARLTRQVTSAKLAGAGGDADGSWAAEYLSLGQNIPLRLEKLRQAETSLGRLGPVDAEALTEQAFFGTPAEVRRAAQALVERAADQPVIVNAVLELLPRTPRQGSIGALVERAALKPLPRISDAAWEPRARAALVERLLGMISTTSEDAPVDAMSLLLLESYARRAGLDPSRMSGSAPTPIDARQGVAAAGESWRQWRADAEANVPNQYAPVPLVEIDHRRQGRLAIADGPVQAFALEQVGIAELMAYVVTAERPSRAPAARTAIDEMMRGRRASKHIFEQIATTERCLLALWVARFMEESP